MKKILLTVMAVIFSVQNIACQMRYNPLNNLIYSHPETPEINQNEYRALLAGCIQIVERIRAMNGNRKPAKKELLAQYEFYLKSVGTPTALRTLADLASGDVYYANGSFMQNIFS